MAKTLPEIADDRTYSWIRDLAEEYKPIKCGSCGRTMIASMLHECDRCGCGICYVYCLGWNWPSKNVMPVMHCKDALACAARQVASLV
ncbi:MAG: hypothetical protein UY96_C0010G0021 [Parcubacteria group bacterium GW2011_GWB1_56_8]|nr:MAG: hypothetical protein UY96_C0010G0021 [Parcubacteria group bacterium GW2011_GWB1_56_8]